MVASTFRATAETIGALTMSGRLSDRDLARPPLRGNLTFNGVGTSTASISRNTSTLAAIASSKSARERQHRRHGPHHQWRRSGSGNLTKTDLGVLELAGSSANTYAGTTTVTDGTLALNKTAGVQALGAGGLTIGDGVGAASSASLKLLA